MSKQLTKAEEQIMQVLWELNEASVKEVIDKLQSQNQPTILYLPLSEF